MPSHICIVEDLKFNPGIFGTEKLTIEVLLHHPSSFQFQGEKKYSYLAGDQMCDHSDSTSATAADCHLV